MKKIKFAFFVSLLISLVISLTARSYFAFGGEWLLFIPVCGVTAWLGGDNDAE